MKLLNQNKMKQTPVQYLVYLLETQKFITKSQIFIAQKMEEQQILDAYEEGYKLAINGERIFKNYL